MCDDGDVIAYLVRSIHHSIRENQESVDITLVQSTTLRPFLLTNVGVSAWGLAVHKAARLIAVSSNYHRISVFAFALQKNSSWASFHEEEAFGTDVLGNDLWEKEINEPRSPHDRDRNVEIILDGHATNIPNIAFCNTGTDLIGDYLVSIDINGNTFLWSVWRRELLGIFTLDLDPSATSRLLFKNPPSIYQLR